MAEYVVEEVVLSSRKDERGGFTTEIVGLGELRERVVRCRDCANAIDHLRTKQLDCLHFAQWDYYNDEPGIWPVEPDGFCKWGKPREGE